MHCSLSSLSLPPSAILPFSKTRRKVNNKNKKKNPVHPTDVLTVPREAKRFNHAKPVPYASLPYQSPSPKPFSPPCSSPFFQYVAVPSVVSFGRSRKWLKEAKKEAAKVVDCFLSCAFRFHTHTHTHTLTHTSESSKPPKATTERKRAPAEVINQNQKKRNCFLLRTFFLSFRISVDFSFLNQTEKKDTRPEPRKQKPLKHKKRKPFSNPKYEFHVDIHTSGQSGIVLLRFRVVTLLCWLCNALNVCVSVTVSACVCDKQTMWEWAGVRGRSSGGSRFHEKERERERKRSFHHSPHPLSIRLPRCAQAHTANTLHTREGKKKRTKPQTNNNAPVLCAHFCAPATACCCCCC